MYLLDTDACVYWLRGHPSVRKELSRIAPANLAISTITLIELYYGAECSNRRKHNLGIIGDFLSAIAIIGADDNVARKFAQIKALLRRNGNLIEDFDLLIAATALTHNRTLITNNLGHFKRIPELNLENWVSK